MIAILLKQLNCVKPEQWKSDKIWRLWKVPKKVWKNKNKKIGKQYVGMLNQHFKEIIYNSFVPGQKFMCQKWFNKGIKTLGHLFLGLLVLWDRHMILLTKFLMDAFLGLFCFHCSYILLVLFLTTMLMISFMLPRFTFLPHHTSQLPCKPSFLVFLISNYGWANTFYNKKTKLNCFK